VRDPIRLATSVHWRAVTFPALSFVLIAAPAMAQEAASTPENSPAGWVFRWINFAIVFAAIVYFFAKVAAPLLRSRSEEIAQSIAEGARAREAAEKLRREVQAKLAGIDQEVAKLHEEAKRSTEAESARLKALARREAEIIERGAQAEILAAERAAALEIKAIAARLAVEGAGVVLANQITPEAQASLFHRFVAELERSAN
jgi:F-type H+-transporting ATPase subunit b